VARVKILSVGYRVYGDGAKNVDLGSQHSLLDAEIVVFRPGFYYNRENQRSLKNLPWLDPETSFRLTQQVQHWHSELQAAMNAGVFVVVLLAQPEVVILRVDQYEKHLSSYSALPMELRPKVRQGTEVVTHGDSSFLAPYWASFQQHSAYEVTLGNPFGRTILKTRFGNHPVGCLHKSEKGGFVLLLPPIRPIDRETASVKGFAAAMASVADSLRVGRRSTPPPDWATSEKWRLPKEDKARGDIRDVHKQVDQLHERLDRLQREELEAGRLRSLLCGTGDELELAIIDALKLFGFSATPHCDGESQFDIVFEADGSRFLGEAEGRDKRAINVDKHSQLERNINEDFEREETTSYAQGVLFGNGHRLCEPENRGDCFTTKCIAAAKRSGTALVRTIDMFDSARYLSNNDDPAYAAACRSAIADARGRIVAMPPPPDPLAPPAAIGVLDTPSRA
jgi:hypothetical protein